MAGVLGVLGVVLAASVHSRWSSFLGGVLCAMTGLLISPVTWTHQMVWVIPVVVWLGVSPDRPRWGRSAAAFTTVLFWITPIWWVPNGGKGPLHEHGWQLIAGNSFFLCIVLLLVACAASMFQGRRLATRVAATVRRTGGLAGPDECPELVGPSTGVNGHRDLARWWS